MRSVLATAILLVIITGVAGTAITVSANTYKIIGSDYSLTGINKICLDGYVWIGYNNSLNQQFKIRGDSQSIPVECKEDR